MKISVHTTDRSSFKRCRQRWDFSSNLRMNLQSRTPITPLFFGTNIHAGLARYYDPQWNERDGEAAIEVFRNKTLQHLVQFQDPTPETVQWVDDQLDLGTGMLKHYFWWAKRNDAFDVVFVEKNMDVSIPGLPGVEYNFTLDGLVVDRHRRHWILEHKTAAQIFEDQEWLSNDDQCGSYLWALTRLEPSIIAEGVIYNTLRKKAPQRLRSLKNGDYSSNKTQDTTYGIAKKMLKDKYGTIPSKYNDLLEHLQLKGENFVQRVPVRRNRREIDAIGEFMRYEVMDMINDPVIYRSPSRINCSGCPFLVPCIMKWEGSDYDYYLEAQYKKREKEW